MNIFTRQPIRRQVVLAACALMLPTLLSIAWSANRSRLERLREAEAEAGRLAATSAAYLDQLVAQIDILAGSMGLHSPVADLDSVAAQQMLARMLNRQPLLLNIALMDANGTLVASARPVAGGSLVQHARMVIANDARVVGSASTDAASGKPSVALTYSVRSRDGTAAGALAMIVDVTELERAFNQLPLLDGAVIAVHDRSDHVVFGSGEARAADRFFGDAELKRTPWVLTVGVPRSVVMARVMPLWRRNTILAGFVLGGTFLLSFWLATALSKSLRGLHTATARIAGGDLSPIASRGGPNREVAELQDAFMTMAKNLRESQDAVTQQVLQERQMKEALQSLQNQVVRQERLAAVGALASGIAHELNNPLQAIQGSAELLERQVVGADTRAELTFIKAQCRRAGEVVRSLARFSSQPVGPPSLIDLRDVVAEALKLGARNDDGAPTVTVHTAPTRRVLADVAELEQVTLCLLINAEQAIARANISGGRIDIHILERGDRVRLEVHDNGPGVGAEDEPKLFQPFFTRKPAGQGNGLGLSVSYGIIRALGGTIGYIRNEQGGATFYVELPAVDLHTGPANDDQAVLRRSV